MFAGAKGVFSSKGAVNLGNDTVTVTVGDGTVDLLAKAGSVVIDGWLSLDDDDRDGDR